MPHGQPTAQATFQEAAEAPKQFPQETNDRSPAKWQQRAAPALPVRTHVFASLPAQSPDQVAKRSAVYLQRNKWPIETQPARAGPRPLLPLPGPPERPTTPPNPGPQRAPSRAKRPQSGRLRD